MAGKRLYLGRLPADARSDDVKKHFEGYGTITECRVMTGFGFIEFESGRDAEDVVNNFHNKPFMGSNIVVEFAKETRRRDDRGGDYGGRGGPPPRRTEQRRPVGIRVNVSGISRDTSWQDLKDFGREAGNVSFADVERDVPGRGVLEYLTVEDAELAVRSLDGKDLRGVAVRLALDEHGARRSPPRRDRSRSPGSSYRRRDDRAERRRSRSPPPRRYEERREEREYRRDDRRGDDRREERAGYERERPDRRFDDRARDDERGERGDGGWDNRR